MRSVSVFSISGAGNSMARPHQSTGVLFKRLSSASSCRSISCSNVSEDWLKTCFFSLAVRSRRVDQLVMGAQSACKAMTKASGSAGSSGWSGPHATCTWLPQGSRADHEPETFQRIIRQRGPVARSNPVCASRSPPSAANCAEVRRAGPSSQAGQEASLFSGW